MHAGFRLALLVYLLTSFCFARNVSVSSPGARNEIELEVGTELSLKMVHLGKVVAEFNRIGMLLGDSRSLGLNPEFVRVTRKSQDSTFKPALYAKRQSVRDYYNSVEVEFAGGYGLEIRAYDDAVAYRWHTWLPSKMKVVSETAELSSSPDAVAYLPIVNCEIETKRGGDCYHSSFENPYSVTPLKQFSPAQHAYLPILIVPPSGPKLLLTESDLIDYPGMWIRGTAGGTGVAADFAAFPLEEKITGDAFPQRVVVRRADFIAETAGSRTFPWRVLIIADRDGELIESDAVYRLGGNTYPSDWGWLKPGKSQSEWVQNNHLYNVPFRAGYNTDTYKFYVDFSKRFGLGYAFCDAGWSAVTDVFELTPGLDVEQVIRYANEQGVGMVLWTSSTAMEAQMEAALDRFAAWGVRGIMVDFMDRDDQKMVNFYERVAREAAKRHIFVDFHGAYKPTGLERRYPNVVTREAVMASEYFKWSSDLTPEYEATIPFIRMAAGPLDYEPGFMKNAQKDQFRAIDAAPMSMGTRIHQLAMFVVYESPYSKMSGNVSDYLLEPQMTRFMAAIPNVWQETRVLDARLSDLVVVMRTARDGSIYVGALTDWSARKLEIPASFLPEGKYRAEIYRDGVNADQYGIDYLHETREITRAAKIAVDMAPGGGWVAKFTPVSAKRKE